MARFVKNPGIGRGYHQADEREFSCVKCGNTFTARRSDVLYCETCKILRKRERSALSERTLAGKCPDCGKEITRKSGRCRECAVKAGSYVFTGESNPFWKGGQTNHRGYIRIKNPDPNGRPRYIGEHVLVWEKANGPVPQNWDVHHLNGIKSDNRLENLFAMSKSDHHSDHHQFYEARIHELEQKLREASF